MENLKVLEKNFGGSRFNLSHELDTFFEGKQKKGTAVGSKWVV